MPPVRRRWGKVLLKSLVGAGFAPKVLEMRDGERFKRLASVEKLAEDLVKLGADRNAIVIAFGGGVVGDVAGMLASVYMRGVQLVQIPTTVQAQLDAAIGGKTGVNLKSRQKSAGHVLSTRGGAHRSRHAFDFARARIPCRDVRSA